MVAAVTSATANNAKTAIMNHAEAFMDHPYPGRATTTHPAGQSSGIVPEICDHRPLTQGSQCHMLVPMTVTPATGSPARPRDPWFRLHPEIALLVAVALFGAILTLRLLTGTPLDAFSMLYALPVALVASAFGLRGGAVAGVVAVGLIVVWVGAQHVTLSPTGWASRVLPLLLLGVLLGQAVDQGHRAEQERRRLEGSALLHREAIEVNDLLVQGLAAARLYFESGDVGTGRRILDETINQARELVSGLIRRADMGGQSVPVEHREG
jgi:hypothetical protein